MSEKFIYQNARIKSLESKLLTSQNLSRVLECGEVADYFKILLELGFGAGINVSQNDFDLLFSAEETATLNLLREFNVDGALDVFLLQADYNNLKALIKAEIVKDENPVLLADGLIDKDNLKVAVKENKISDLPVFMQTVIKTVEKLILEDKITPHTIDTLADKAMYADILSKVKKQSALTKKYFVEKIDFINIASFLRSKKLGLDDKFFEEGFIEGGSIQLKFFTEVYDSPLEAFKEKCRFTDYKAVVSKTVEGGNIVAMEVDMDNQLLKMWKDESGDMFSVAPIVSFYLSKTTEIKVLKLIVAGVKNKVAPEIIRERMRDIYA